MDVVCVLESKFIALLIYEINNKSIYMYTIMKKFQKIILNKAFGQGENKLTDELFLICI